MNGQVSSSGWPALVLNADFRPLSYYPLSLWSWQDTIKAVFLERVNIVANYERSVRSPSLEMKLPSVVSLKTFVKPATQPAFTRFNVFLRDKFSCQYCGRRDDLTFDQVVAATGLDERTLRSLARGTTHAHARTLHKLAQGLGVEVDELFQAVGRTSPRRFDRATNSLVEGCVAHHAKVFHNWSESDFDELYSRFGTGGQLTEEGILAAAQAANAKRDLWRQVSIILESGEAELLASAYRSSLQLAEENAGRVRFVKLNIDDNIATAARYGVLSVPTTILFEGGEEREKVMGAYPRSRYEQAWAEWL